MLKVWFVGVRETERRANGITWFVNEWWPSGEEAADPASRETRIRSSPELADNTKKYACMHLLINEHTSPQTLSPNPINFNKYASAFDLRGAARPKSKAPAHAKKKKNHNNKRTNRTTHTHQTESQLSVPKLNNSQVNSKASNERWRTAERRNRTKWFIDYSSSIGSLGVFS